MFPLSQWAATHLCMAKDGGYILHSAQREADSQLCWSIALDVVEQTCIQIDYFPNDMEDVQC